MSEPDLTLDGLSIWVIGRERPDASDYDDGNWLVVRATMQVGQTSVSAEGPMLMATDFERFRSEVARMHERLTGEACLLGLEPNFRLALKASSLGRIEAEAEITPDHVTQFHRFGFELDQSYLRPLIAACEAILERFPVIGRRDGQGR